MTAFHSNGCGYTTQHDSNVVRLIFSKRPQHNYNIGDLVNHRLMLGVNVSKAVAETFLKNYTDQVGKPYPNGKGFYPDYKYRVVEVDEHGYWLGCNEG